MKKIMIFLSIGVVGCGVYIWNANTQEPKAFNDYQTAFGDETVVIGSNVVLSKEHFNTSYEKIQKQYTEFEQVFAYFNELTTSVQFLQEMNDLMFNLIIESDDTGLVYEQTASIKNNDVLTPLVQMNFLGYLSQKPKFLNAYDLYEQSIALNQQLFTYLVLMNENQDETINDQLLIDLPLRYEEIKKQFSLVLVEFFNMLYPNIMETLTPIGYRGSGTLSVTPEEIQKTLVNYINISNRYYEQLLTYCKNMEIYRELLNVLNYFDTIYSDTSGSGDYNQSEIKPNFDEILATFNGGHQTISHALEQKAESLIQSDIPINEQLIEKLLLADQLLKQYFTLAKQNQEELLNRSSVSSKQIETYSILYGLIQSIYMDLNDDPVFNQFYDKSESRIEGQEVLVKGDEQAA